MSGGAATGNADGMSVFLQLFLPLILFFGVMWFFLIRPQRKKDKETRDMRSNIAEGDEIVTIGGIIGRVLSVKEDSIVIYCGSDKTKMEFKKWAISEVTKKNEKNEKAVKLDKSGKSSESNDGRNAENTGDKGVNKKSIKKLTRKDDTGKEAGENAEGEDREAETEAE